MENSNLLKKLISSENLALVLMTIFAIVVRLLPHIPNVAPVTGFAIFSGAYASRKKLVLPLVAMFISDIFLGFYNSMIFVYGSFLLVGLLSSFVLPQKKSLWRIVSVSLISSLLFYIITNFGVWVDGGLYARTLQGLVACYIYALPFLRFTVIGDLLYTGLFVGGFEVVRVLRWQLAKMII